MKQTASLPGEFELIARYFAPLARGFPVWSAKMMRAAFLASRDLADQLIFKV